MHWLYTEAIVTIDVKNRWISKIDNLKKIEAEVFFTSVVYLHLNWRVKHNLNQPNKKYWHILWHKKYDLFTKSKKFLTINNSKSKGKEKYYPQITVYTYYDENCFLLNQVIIKKVLPFTLFFFVFLIFIVLHT